MSEHQTIQPTSQRFDGAFSALACIVGGLAVWMLVPEILRPPIEFTTNLEPASLGYERRDAAVTAARIALVRGDLWSEAAFAYGGSTLRLEKDTSNPEGAPFELEQTRAVTEKAITYAPHDSRLWLLLAANDLRFDRLNERAKAALKMSYYTGSNTIAVVPKRLLLAVQGPALDDEELQELVRHDIRVTVNHKSKLMPALIAAYQNAPQSGRQFIEKALSEIDLGVLAVIRSGAEHR
jgi:hypothetical protein